MGVLMRADPIDQNQRFPTLMVWDDLDPLSRKEVCRATLADEALAEKDWGEIAPEIRECLSETLFLKSLSHTGFAGAAFWKKIVLKHSSGCPVCENRQFDAIGMDMQGQIVSCDKCGWKSETEKDESR
jgi:hypothetical protein